MKTFLDLLSALSLEKQQCIKFVSSSCPCFRQRLENEKQAREKAEAERKQLEEEIARLKADQERQARGTQSDIVFLKFLYIVRALRF